MRQDGAGRPEKDRPEKRREKRQRGMTLIELLVVLLILALIAAFAVPRVLQYLGGARHDAAKIQVERLGGILDLYKLDNGHYPTSAEGLQALLEQPAGEDNWKGPYLKKKDSLTDPWGRPYDYQSPGEHGAYDLYTLGADNAQGGTGEDADVTSW